MRESEREYKFEKSSLGSWTNNDTNENRLNCGFQSYPRINIPTLSIHGEGKLELCHPLVSIYVSLSSNRAFHLLFKVSRIDEVLEAPSFNPTDRVRYNCLRVEVYGTISGRCFHCY